MGRTPEQRAADEALRAAVADVIKLSSGIHGDTGDADGVLTKFMVIAVQVRFDEEGDASDVINIMYSDGKMLGYEAEGLLRVADRVFSQDGFRRNTSYEEGEE